MQGPRFDKDPGDGGGWLVCMGKQLKLSAQELEVVNACLGPQDALSHEQPASYRCYRHTVANIHGDQLATSVAHRRSSSRNSSYVLVRSVSIG